LGLSEPNERSVAFLPRMGRGCAQSMMVPDLLDGQGMTSMWPCRESISKALVALALAASRKKRR
jgi:hypothetical protein